MCCLSLQMTLRRPPALTRADRRPPEYAFGGALFERLAPEEVGQLPIGRVGAEIVDKPHEVDNEGGTADFGGALTEQEDVSG